jgi:hypothetical protein
VQIAIVEEMEAARSRSREFVNGAKYLRDRGAVILAAARTRMIGMLSGSAVAIHDESRTSASDADLPSRFRAYAETWRRQTQHYSSVSKMISHPAYTAIIEMGREAVPLLLEELRDRPDHWLVALNRITREDPAPSGSTFSEAVEAWLGWGRERGYLQ